MTTARPLVRASGPRQVDPRTGEILDADIGIDPVRAAQPRASARRADSAAGRRSRTASLAHRRTACAQYASECAAQETELRARPARGARRDRPGQPRSRGVRRSPTLKDVVDARGRPHARPAPQLPRVDRLHAGAARRPRVHAAERHRRLGDGLQRRQHRAAKGETQGAYDDDRRSVPTTTGRSSTRYKAIAAGAGSRRAREDRRARQQRAAARLRRPTRTPRSPASTRTRTSSTSAAIRSPIARSGSLISRASCGSAGRRAS